MTTHMTMASPAPQAAEPNAGLDARAVVLRRTGHADDRATTGVLMIAPAPRAAEVHLGHTPNAGNRDPRAHTAHATREAA